MSDKTIFYEALAKPAENRAAFLEQACGGNQELRQRVEALLKEHEDVDRFLETPPIDPDATPRGTTNPDAAVDPRAVTENRPLPTLPAGAEQPTDEETFTREFSPDLPSRIGPYHILQKLGEGGFGVVYLAEQRQPVRRRVALKVIKAGMDTRDVIARFEAERQALAMMDHANIARVLDAGATDHGRPYFVMQLVKGVPITEYCDTHKLSIKGRLELFMQVCQAIQHAHQKGIIHRDIKPSNVLVALDDNRPVPKVIDFGVAKAIDQRLTEKTIYTHLGQVIGTPIYMSPEQAQRNQMDIDTRSDVYSLGVLLYELLTGTTPLERHKVRAAAFDEMLRMIREVEPPKPSTRISESGESLSTISTQRHIEPRKLTTAVRGELDWIVMKALEKDRTRRYDGAGAFAADIQRYLDDEPVAAGPPSTAYRLRKFARKHRRLIATAAGLAAVLLVAMIISVWQAIRATQAEKTAQEQRNRAVAAEDKEREARVRQEQLKQQALDSLQEARTAADQWLINLSGDLLYYPGLNPTRERLLREAERHYKTFSARTSDDPRLNLEYARSAVRLGDVQRLLGDNAAAMVAYTDAEAMFQQLLDTQPDNRDVQLELANARIGRGLVLSQTGKPRDEAEQMFAAAAKILERLLAAEPRNAEYRNARGRTALALSELLADADQHQRREELLRESIDVFQQLADESDNPKYRSRLAEAMFQLAAALRDSGRNDEAVDVLQAAIANYDRMIETNQARPDTFAARAACRIALADALRELGQYKPAVAAHDAALVDYELAVERMTAPLDAQLYLKLAGQQYDRLAEFSMQLGANTDAKGLAIEAVSVFINLVNGKPNEPEFVLLESNARTRLAEILGELSENELAEQHFQEAIAKYHELREFYPTEQPYRASFGACLCKYAVLLESMSRADDARIHYEQAISHLQAAVDAGGNDDARIALAECHASFGDLHRVAGDAEKADALYRKAIALWDEMPDNAAARFAKAWLLADAVGASVQDPPRAVSIAEELAKAQPNEIAVRQLLGVCYLRAGKWEQAINLLQQTIATRPIDDAFDWCYLALAYHHSKQPENSQASDQRALEAMQLQRPGNLQLQRLRAEVERVTTSNCCD